jgi:hypothetical protein
MDIVALGFLYNVSVGGIELRILSELVASNFRALFLINLIGSDHLVRKGVSSGARANP